MIQKKTKVLLPIELIKSELSNKLNSRERFMFVLISACGLTHKDHFDVIEHANRLQAPYKSR